MEKIFEVVLKVFATSLFLKFILSLFSALSGLLSVGEQIGRMYFFSGLVSSGLYLLFSFLIWNFPTNIAKIYIKEDNTNINFSNIDYKKIKEVSFSVVGIIFLTRYLPVFISKTIGWINIFNNNFSQRDPSIMENILALSESFFIVLISLFLIFGIKNIQEYLKKMFSNIE